MCQLANYAVKITQGRDYLEPVALYRNDFQRDRDRIIHSSAFRRLEYKTQVFINHEGDLFRTRLTHSLEVAQVGRSIANALNLNSDLVEAICLAHDLGHPPFGHLGQDVLNSCLKEYSLAFEHNIQSLRVVKSLEERYPDFDGLNLTFETQEGILKHCPEHLAHLFGRVGERFLLKLRPSLEAQLANLADELAYNLHDLDDGLRANLLNLDQLEQIPWISTVLNQIRAKYPHLHSRRLHKELIRQLTNQTIIHLIEQTKVNLTYYKPNSVIEVRQAPLLVSYASEIYTQQRELKTFLLKNLYNHSSVMQLRFKAQLIISSLFKAYMSNWQMLPEQYQSRLEDTSLARVVADYIAGMTDRYAFRQYNRLFTIEHI
ncbi:MAG: hypothetical protein RLZZ293_1291 [Pseudomonadota bacterium]|jgi:dGTPase